MYWYNFGCSLLLTRKNRVLHAFADAELERRFGRNLYGLARGRIAPLTSLSLGADELAEAWQSELSIGFDFAACEISQFVEEFLDLCALQACLFRKVVDDLRLCHALLT